jgi:glycerophosphoryl diester phosphodiesterase
MIQVTFFDSSEPLVLAHRGASMQAPENTLAAFDLGEAAGADGLELDVHLSADGVVVVHHDRTLDRTTDATGPIAQRTVAELARVDAAFSFRNAAGAYPFRGQGIGVPTFADVLRRYPNRRLAVEMKVDSAAMGEAVARDVRRAGAVERVCAAGAGSRSATAARAALPGMACSATSLEIRLALYRSWLGWPVRHPRYGGYQIPEVHGATRIVSPRFIQHAHASNLKVQVWTVDDERDMERLLGWGVDALITNRPDAAVTIRNRVMRAASASRT